MIDECSLGDLVPQPLLFHVATIGVALWWVGWAVLLHPVAVPLRQDGGHAGPASCERCP